ncbi:ImmA/IrrE family metallo-endopeptidase [Vallitalea guaymasensis]|uniref:ImmA/IrrE family metallo-endopeptidase n=1 Tax=Vallitalea guaymasensis TaxID=1185412 RepID=UPI001FD0F36E|nr:ImmA/IrrE family metallo-endopeptidase [Vallitalea guaymasensis]
MTNYIVRDVNKLIMKYKTRDPFEIADDLNITVEYHDLGNLKWFYFYQSRFRYIVINENIEDRLKPIICAHELGHNRLHQNFAKSKALQEFSFFDMSSKPEKEANLFMAELLVTDDSMMELIKLGYCYEFIANKIGVPKASCGF